ncbi:unnamed protein product [Lymnaea stagnalis]|uniref:BHLH domain-containing protein n=1 Tax=Lymnaea stagnalis TaxID=6523 RepID=A0AAV2IAR6_LYMST
MSLDDRGIAPDQFIELKCGAENLSPYSSPTGYAENSSYYPSEYDWQQQAAGHHTALPHHQQQILTDRHYYGHYPESVDLGGQPYADYGHQTVPHADFYPTPHALWPTANSSDPIVPSQHHRFFSGIDLSQQGGFQQPSPPSGSSGKPKRKRVQSHTQRKAANVRERKRMFHLNEAFDELRKRLPAFNYEKRLSRIETLRLAMTYISFMKEVSIGRDPKSVKLKPHGAELSPLGHGGGLLDSHASYSGSDLNEDSNVQDDSDCSNDELSNHSGGN